MQNSQSIANDTVPQKEIRALLLDDSNFDRQRIRRLGARITDLPLQLDEVGTLAEMEAALDRSAYDVILVDYRLAEGDGVQALERISAKASHNSAARIMITGNEDIGTAVQAMRRGCHDFLAKDTISADVLRGAMLNAMALARRNVQVERQMAAQREVIRECMLEALTDSDVQKGIGTIVQTQLAQFSKALQSPALASRTDEVDAFIAGMAEADEFIFAPSLR